MELLALTVATLSAIIRETLWNAQMWICFNAKCLVSISHNGVWIHYSPVWISINVLPVSLLLYFQQDATIYTLFISGKLLYTFRVVSPPIIRSTHNCIYSIWYLSNRHCYLPLMWKSWNWFECGVGIVLFNISTIQYSSTIAACSSNGLTSTKYCKYSCVCSWWWAETPPETCRAVSRYK